LAATIFAGSAFVVAFFAKDSRGSPALKAEPKGVDDLSVVCSEARIDGVVYNDALGQARADNDGPRLLLWLNIENHGATRKIDYRGWSVKSAGVSLSDELGNEYRMINYGVQVRGPDWSQVVDASIYPEKGQEDLLIFERPLKAAKLLTLTLPAENLGGHGTIPVSIKSEEIVERFKDGRTLPLPKGAHEIWIWP
jgi:hypothetical protein